ncbi:MAG: VWA domain-containing protein [Vicinamibacterales bacterium]
MRYRWSLAAVVALGTLVTAQSALILAQAPQRALYVSVVDRKGQPAPNIGPNDLIIREDNVAREILRVTPATDPIQIALLVDTSQAARDFIRDYRQAVPAFLDLVLGEESSGQNQVALIGIGERPTILTDYTRDRAALTEGVNRLFSLTQSGTYLLDGILEVSQGFKKRGAERAVIVAIVSEGPELSNRNYRLVLDELEDAGATLHIVAIGTPVNRNEDRSLTMSMGTKNSGGRYDTVLISSALTTRLQDLAREINGQYRVTYARPESLIPPEKIEVSAKRSGLTARGIPVPQPQVRPAGRDPGGRP